MSKKIEEIRESIINSVTSALMPKGISEKSCEIFIDNILTKKQQEIEKLRKENEELKELGSVQLLSFCNWLNEEYDCLFQEPKTLINEYFKSLLKRVN